MAQDSTFRKRRYLPLLEIADLVGVDPNIERRARRRRIERIFRGFEQRDGVAYLHKSSRTGVLTVCADDLHLLDPWDPNTTHRLREDLDALVEAHSRLKRRFKKLEDYCEQVSDYLKSLARPGTPLAHEKVH